MTLIHNNSCDIFKNKVNLLVIDDEPLILDAVIGIFSSPLFNITTGSTLQEAYKIINKTEVPWHCWILDINIEREEDGFEILKKYPKFPFAIMLSGLRSMTIASKAMQCGAIGVFDKEPASLDLLYDGVRKIASLGFLLGGKGSQYLQHFQLLMTNQIKNPEEWANLACISVRQLERICAIQSSLSPRLALSLFYTLYCFLCNKPEIFSELPNVSNVKQISDNSDFYQSHINFFHKHIDKYKEIPLKQPSFSG